MKNFKFVLLAFSMSAFIFSCTKDKDVLQAKPNQEEIEAKTVVTGKPWESISRIMVPLRGHQMVPGIQTNVVGNIVFNLRYGKYVNYRLTLYKLPPGEYATMATLFMGTPGMNGMPRYTVPFLPTDNGVTKRVDLSQTEFNLLVFLLSNKAIAPPSYFVISTSSRPGGLLRGQVVLP